MKLSELMRLLATSAAQKLIIDFNIDEPKLEDVYLLLTADEDADIELQELPMIEV